MKRIFCVLLVCALLFSGGTSAIAADSIDDSGQQQGQEQQSTVTAGTLEELQAAIAAAENGDTIAISAEIRLDGVTLETDKDIALVRANIYGSGAFMRLRYGAKLSGFRFLDYLDSTIICDSSWETPVEIESCYFYGDSVHTRSFIVAFGGINYPNQILIDNCTFDGASNSAITSRDRLVLTASNCVFTNNSTDTQGGAIHNDGTLILDNCIFRANKAVSGGSIYSSGELTITDCLFDGNSVGSEKFGTDVLSFGTLSINDDPQDDAGYYDESTGEKITLPLADYTDTAKLIYLTTEQAAEYFAPSPSPDDEEQEADTPAETPTEPPQQPESGEGEDTPADNETPPTTPVPPQDEPDNDGEDDYTPPVVNRPTRPTRPVVPTPDPEPEEEPAPALVCGDAVIDTSRSVILLGYGDGQLHLEDNLTRAQMATIIYRLLDADSIARYDSADTVFADVAPDAWHCRYVTTIANAEIVCGVGNGNYNPDAPLTWGHIVTVMSRFVAAQDCELQHIQYSGWAQDAVATAVALGWIADSAEFDPDALITRGQLVEFVNGVLEQYR